MVKTVLYLAKDPLNRPLMEEVFGLLDDIDLITVLNSAEFLAAVAAKPVELVLMDVGLPGDDSYRLLKAVKNNQATRHLPVYALSSAAFNTDVERGLTAGFDAYFTKPLNLRDLLSAVRENNYLSLAS